MGSTGTMTGRTVLVTGATSGIGLETARQLAAMGATCGSRGTRSRARARRWPRASRARAARRKSSRSIWHRFASVREAAARLRRPRSAGRARQQRRHRAAAPRRFEGRARADVADQLPLPRPPDPAAAALLRRGTKPRIVNVSSEGHRTGRIVWDNLELERGYGGFRAYANSKLGQVLFTRELARREPGLAVNALHPAPSRRTSGSSSRGRSGPSSSSGSGSSDGSCRRPRRARRP